MTEATKLRHLVACTSCQRQFDASGRDSGSKFHCSCGEIVEVPPPAPHESAVVRCSSCGAPRQGRTTECQFCDSDFTLHEQDLDTICPGCATRISRKARYCHACALPITPQGTAGERVEAGCPVCGAQQHLVSRALGTENVSVLECPRCTGMWLGGSTFQLLEESARERRLSWSPERVSRNSTPRDLGNATEPLYRPCPECKKLMNRRNYGRRSGVIVDVCTQHGVWFDLDELARILRWIRNGGLAHAQEQDLMRAQAEARRPSQSHWPGGLTDVQPPASKLGTLLERVLRGLLS